MPEPLSAHHFEQVGDNMTLRDAWVREAQGGWYHRGWRAETAKRCIRRDRVPEHIDAGLEDGGLRAGEVIWGPGVIGIEKGDHGCVR